MAIKMLITNCVLSVTLVLLSYTTPGVYGSVFCQSSSPFQSSRYCDDDEYCCGIYDTDCCLSFNPNSPAMEAFSLFIVLFVLICCPVMCYRCCCRRTTHRGIIYSQAPGTTTNVAVTIPTQQGQQPVPYPTVVPYPQQTPYPPQYPTNPYYGMPPPPYGVATEQAGTQQASAPSAPYLQS